MNDSLRKNSCVGIVVGKKFIISKHALLVNPECIAETVMELIILRLCVEVLKTVSKGNGWLKLEETDR